MFIVGKSFFSETLSKLNITTNKSGQNIVGYPSGVPSNMDPLQRANCDEGNLGAGPEQQNNFPHALAYSLLSVLH